ncbi:lanC-like protein 3 [Gigantopelta aegis]|uniref:lanC-like protein 3 n=1 Tax=Gigantopelta aegis TaxID=1735272 RepID=UPI001B88C8D8|nr:lanC-like protein 3 [Gigantopelta aegis]
MPRPRYFVNKLADFVSGNVVQIDKDKWHQTINSIVEEIERKMPPDLEHCDGGLYVGNAGVAYTFYHLSVIKSFGDIKHNLLEKALQYFNISLKFATSSSCRDPRPSFILGKAGVFAVGSLISKEQGNKQLMEDFIAKYAQFYNECLNPNFYRHGSDELFVGRAGYLCGVFLLQKKLGVKVLDDKAIQSLCAVTVQSGRDFARKHQSKCPLMYDYHGTQYLGAAHGLSSILQTLLCFPDFLKVDPMAEQDIRHSVDFLLSLEQPNHNYAPAMDDVGTCTRPESQELVHWCHGAPGIIYLFARAYIVWGDSKYLDACIRCGELTWQRGLLTKGPGICHGVSGNGYVFLLLFRLTGDQKHLHRAQQFAEFMFSHEFQSGARTPDSPFSLYEGWAGSVCFLADLLQPEKAAFPFFDIF